MLAAVSVVFVATVVAGAEAGSTLGYVQAAAEASMVGALADWFAVVALFRHPLGLPIPHTAIITERKAQFGETLGEFIHDSFLTPDAVAERVRAAGVGTRIASWLVVPANADKLAGHTLAAAVEVVDLIEDDAVHDVLERLLRERIEAASDHPHGGPGPRRAHPGGTPRRGRGRGPQGPRPLPRRAPGRAPEPLP